MQIIDVHTHIFPPEVRENRGEFLARDPVFAQLYSSEKAKIMGAREILAHMEEEGVAASVAFGFPWQDLETAAWHNDYVLDAAKRFEGRLIPFACFDIRAKGSFGEAERCLGKGHRGLGELAFYEGFDSSSAAMLSPFLGLCGDAGVPMMVHVNEPVGHEYHGKAHVDFSALYRLIKRHPETEIILAHMGGGLFFYESLKREVKDALANVYYDTAAAPFLYRIETYRFAVDIVGAEKILLGSDYPLIGVARYLAEMEEGGLTPEEIRMIAGENARRLILEKEDG